MIGSPDPLTRWEIPSSQLVSPDSGSSVGDGVLLAVDWGDRRVGFALSDRERRFSWPVDPFVRQAPGRFSGVKDLLLVEAVRKLVLDEDIVGMIFGVPYYHLSGDPNPKAQDFFESGRRLSREIPLPILFWDEGLSSEMARSDPFARKSGKKGKSFSKNPWIDSRSASLVLESYLTSLRCCSKNSLDTLLLNNGGPHSNEP